jgi:hypothetical protein
MTFDRKGRLLKATHLPVGQLAVKAVPPGEAEPKGAPLPPTIQEIDAAGNGFK